MLGDVDWLHSAAAQEDCIILSLEEFLAFRELGVVRTGTVSDHKDDRHH